MGVGVSGSVQVFTGMVFKRDCIPEAESPKPGHQDEGRGWF